MDSIGIYTQANDLVRSIGTRDPEQIVQDMGIMLLYEDGLDQLLGMYTNRWRHRIMILNPRMDDALKKM